MVKWLAGSPTLSKVETGTFRPPIFSSPRWPIEARKALTPIKFRLLLVVIDDLQVIRYGKHVWH